MCSTPADEATEREADLLAPVPELEPEVQIVRRSELACPAVDEAPGGLPALIAIWTAPWAPAATARRTGCVRLGAAFAAHLAAGLLTVAVVSILAWLDTASTPFLLIGQMVTEFLRDPLEWAVIVGLVVLGIEAGVLLLAALIMPWGAREERIGESFRHGLRWTWIATGLAVPGVFLSGLAFVVTFEASRDFRSGDSFRYTVPAPVAPKRPVPYPAAGSPERRAYDEALTRYEEAVAEWQKGLVVAQKRAMRTPPLLVKYREVVQVNAVLGLVAWFVWVLLRGAAARIVTPADRSAPLCEACGYNLTSMPAEAMCPECGQPVRESVDPTRRRGTVWERREEIGRVRAYLRSAWEAFFSPMTPGAAMQTRVTRWDGARLLIWNLAVCVPLLMAGVIATMCYFLAPNMRPSRAEIVTGLAPMLTAAGILVLIGWLCLCGAVVMIETMWRDGRNVGQIAVRVGCHHSAMLIPWAILGAAQFFTLMWIDQSRFYVTLRGQMNLDLIVAPLVIAVNLVPGLWFLSAVRRGVSAARFANT